MGKLLKTTSIYIFGNVVSRIMGIVLTTLATHMLSNTADLGFFRTISDLMLLILNIANIQIWMALLRFVFNFNKIRNKFKVISTAYFIGISTFFIFSVSYIFFFLIKFIITKQFSLELFLELYLLSAGYVFNQIVQFSCRGLNKNRLYVISGIFGAFMQLVSGIFLMAGLKLTSNALLLALIISYFSQGLFIELFLKTTKKIKLKLVSLKLAKKMLRYSIFTALNFASYTFNQRGGNIIISIFLGNTLSGKYACASTLLSAVSLFVMAFNFAFQEFSFTAQKQADLATKNRIYSRTLNYFVRFIGGGTLILMPLTSLYFSIFVGDSYKSSQNLIPLLYTASIFDSVQTFLGLIMQAEKKVKFMFITQLLGSIVTLTSMLITMNYFGLQAVGISMTFCFVSVSFLRLYVLKTKIAIHFNYLFLLHFVPMFLIVTLFYLNIDNIFLNIIFLLFVTLYFMFNIRKLLKQFKLTIIKKLKLN